MEDPKELLRSAVNGSEAALDVLLLQQYDALLRVADSRIPRQLRRIIDPEDVVNDVFIAAMKNISSFDGESIAQFSAWLKTIAKNQIIDVHRKKANADRESVFSLILDVMGEPQNESPSKVVSREEAEQELKGHIARLPERQRKAVTLRFLQELTLEQVAEKMNLSKSAVRSLIHRAKDVLRERMGDINVVSEDNAENGDLSSGND